MTIYVGDTQFLQDLERQGLADKLVVVVDQCSYTNVLLPRAVIINAPGRGYNQNVFQRASYSCQVTSPDFLRSLLRSWEANFIPRYRTCGWESLNRVLVLKLGDVAIPVVQLDTNGNVVPLGEAWQPHTRAGLSDFSRGELLNMLKGGETVRYVTTRAREEAPTKPASKPESESKPLSELDLDFPYTNDPVMRETIKQGWQVFCCYLSEHEKHERFSAIPRVTYNDFVRGMLDASFLTVKERFLEVQNRMPTGRKAEVDGLRSVLRLPGWSKL